MFKTTKIGIPGFKCLRLQENAFQISKVPGGTMLPDPIEQVGYSRLVRKSYGIWSLLVHLWLDVIMRVLKTRKSSP